MSIEKRDTGWILGLFGSKRFDVALNNFMFLFEHKGCERRKEFTGGSREEWFLIKLTADVSFLTKLITTEDPGVLQEYQKACCCLR